MVRVIEGYEPYEFIRFFPWWQDADINGNPPTNLLGKFDALSLIQKPHLATESQLIDYGNGEMVLYRVGSKGEIIEVPKMSNIALFSGDCYLVHYVVTVSFSSNLTNPLILYAVPVMCTYYKPHSLPHSRPKQTAKVQPNQMSRIFCICGRENSVRLKQLYKAKPLLKNMVVVCVRMLCISVFTRIWSHRIFCKSSRVDWLYSKENVSTLIRMAVAVYIPIHICWRWLAMLHIIRRQFKFQAKLLILLHTIVLSFVRLMGIIGFGVVPAQLVRLKSNKS